MSMRSIPLPRPMLQKQQSKEKQWHNWNFLLSMPHEGCQEPFLLYSQHLLPSLQVQSLQV
uniref:Uncharacterized protein n=1 Tax=Rhizophagus irregularis (strain DAOM 181602 / DAOM 197198 / MUCL 43194) TaxID=747089 RepID=U9UGA5_RHIID